MPSPFPGMNPYLEQADTWQEFHNSYIVRMQAALSRRVGPNYIVKVDIRLLMHERSPDERPFFVPAKEVDVSEPSRNHLKAPLRLELPPFKVERFASLEIRELESRRVVTVLELLSPSDREDYMAKRRSVLAGMTHLVELDFRRGGQRPDLPELPSCDYYVLISKYEDRPGLDFWPISLRDPLPIILIPLNAPDPPFELDLQAVLDQTYDDAGYGKYIYGEKPEPPLTRPQQTWAKQFLPQSK